LIAWLCCAVISPLPARPEAAAPAEAFFDYLYIEANTGSSAGGHAAVRFDDTVYHFQHTEPGIVRPYAQSWASFDLAYRGLGNRPIHLQRIAVSADRYERLRGEFRRRLLVAESHAQLFEAVRRDGRFFTCLQNGFEGGDASQCGLRLPGAGYFIERSRRTLGGESASSIAAVSREIAATFGPDFLEGRAQQLQAQIENLRPACEEISAPRADKVSRPFASFADRYAELLLESIAVAALKGELVGDGHSLRQIPGPLTVAERHLLATLIAEQQQRIVRLLVSSRADRGYPLLVGIARLSALQESLRVGELFVLDTYADGGPTLSAAALRPYATVLEEIAAERRGEMNEARIAVFDGAGGEAAWSRFEASANVTLEIDAALAGEKPLRLHQLQLTPARDTSWGGRWPAPRLSTQVLTTARQHAAVQEETIIQQLRELQRYDLLSRNCVTEILRILDDFDGGLAAGLNFIPFVSADAVRAAFRPVEERRLPSYREKGLARMREQQLSLVEAVRESTSLTSTLIPFDFKDELFLFFTDDRVAWRPLLGLANVVTGAAAIAAGALVLPFDGGDLLSAGVRGLFYSFPEIALVNIRKGAVELLPGSWDGPRDPPAGSARALAPRAARGRISHSSGAAPSAASSASSAAAAGASAASAAPSAGTAAAGGAATPPFM
jgi:hypothetical protein